MDIKEELKRITGNRISFNEPMKSHTTFKTGGPAKYYVEINSTDCLNELVNFCKNENIDIFVMGKGSNLLVSDEGYNGLIIKFGKDFDKIEVKGNTVTAQSGATLTKTSNIACENSLSGMEGLGGIPGSVGGAVFMNAGAYGYEIVNVCERVTAFNPEKGIYTVERKDLDFGYRHSVFKENNDIVLEAEFKLEKGDKDKIIADLNEFNRRRKESQPLEYPSAGSTFKRPEGYFAGKLIQDSNLKGKSIGGAQVSEKHAGFVINKGGAKAQDVVSLIDYIRKTVYNNFNVILEPEVIMLGSFKRESLPE